MHRRPFFLHDCDANTRNWYQLHHPDMEQRSVPHSDLVQLLVEHVEHHSSEKNTAPNDPRSTPSCAITVGTNFVPPPPPGGGGGQELMNDYKVDCPSRPEDRALFALRKTGHLKEAVLRFEAILTHPRPEEGERVFIIAFYLHDNTVSVFEKKQPNSGFGGGLYLERRRVKNLMSKGCSGEVTSHGGAKTRTTSGMAAESPVLGSSPSPPPYFRAQDFFVGAFVTLVAREFRIVRADEFTLRFMADHDEAFPLASLRRLVDVKLRHIFRRSCEETQTLYQPVKFQSAEVFKKWFSEEYSEEDGSRPSLTEHEVLTLVRASAAAKGEDCVDLRKVRHVREQ